MVLLSLLLLLPAASAEDADRRAARSGDHAGEQAACLEIVATPTASAARARCERRLRWLALRQDPDGTFRTLGALEQFRRTARTLSSDDARAQATTIARDPGAAAQVQQEAALWLAREALDRDDPAAALAWTTPLWQAAPPQTLDAEVVDLHTRALLRDGQTAAAQAAEQAAAPLRSARPREGLPLLLLEQRRARIGTGARVLLGAYLLLSAPLALRGWTQQPPPRPRPLGLGILLLVTLAFGGISVLREPTVVPHFVLLLGGLGLVHLLSAGALLASGRRDLRLGLRVGAALASAAVGYLVLLASGQLEAVGL